VGSILARSLASESSTSCRAFASRARRADAGVAGAPPRRSSHPGEDYEPSAVLRDSWPPTGPPSRLRPLDLEQVSERLVK
jgi:hypothetical protein